MKPVLLWPKPLSDIAVHLEREPEDFIVVDTNSNYDIQKLSALRSDTAIFDPFPESGRHYRDFLNHVEARHCRHHITGIAACQDVLRTWKDPSLSRATIEEILLAIGHPGRGPPKRRHVLSPLTAFLGRLIGLFLVLVSSAALLDRHTVMETAAALLANRPLLLVAGMSAVLGGLAMVLAHNLWSGGVLAVVITILGWAIVAVGSLLIFLPLPMMVSLWQMLHVEDFFYLYLTITLGLGLYLSWAAFESSQWLARVFALRSSPKARRS
jgi:hypothetical protein